MVQENPQKQIADNY